MRIPSRKKAFNPTAENLEVRTLLTSHPIVEPLGYDVVLSNLNGQAEIIYTNYTTGAPSTETSQVTGKVAVVNWGDNEGSTTTTTLTQTTPDGGLVWIGTSTHSYSDQLDHNITVTITSTFSDRLSYNETFNFEYKPSTSNIGVSVTTQNTLDTGGKFGPYLDGVSYQPGFTVNVSGDTTGEVHQVVYSVDGQSPHQATSNGNEQWTIPLDVGTLSGDSLTHTLTVTAENSGGTLVGSPVTDSLSMQNTLNFGTLTATGPGGVPSGLDATTLRFFAGVSLVPTFSGTVSDLPFYYANTNQVPGVQVGSLQALAPNFDIISTGKDSASFTFSTDVSTLDADGDNSVTLLATAPAGAAPVQFPSGSHLHVIALPDWLTNATPGFDESAGTYTFDVKYPIAEVPSLMSNLDANDGYLDVLINAILDQPTSLGLGVNLRVTAALTTNPGDAVLKVTSWYATATVLGQTLLDETSSAFVPSQMNVQAALDPETLEAPDGISLTTGQIPISDLTNKSLFSKSFGGSLPLIFPALAVFGANISIKTTIQALLNSLDVSAALQLDVTGATPELKKGSFVEVDAAGSGAASLALGGSLSFLGIPLLNATAVGFLAAVAQANLRVDFAGLITGPTAMLDPASSAGISFDYGITYGYSTLGKPIQYQTDFNPTPISPSLFGLKPSVSPNFTSLNNILNGPGILNSAGLPGVPPSIGTVMSVLGSIFGSPSPDIKTSSLEPLALVQEDAVTAPTAQLTLATPVFVPVSDIKFDLNVLSDQANLAAGHHTLDVVLVGLDGSQVPLKSIDLSSSALSANANPLGFSSGWKTIDVPIAQGVLVAGMPYQLEFRLSTDSGADGATVAVAMDNLKTSSLSPQLVVSNPGGSVEGGAVNFGPATGGTGVETIQFANSGQAPLHIYAPVLVGSNVALVNPPAAGYVLLPGESTDLQVELLDRSQPANAKLQISSDDPTQAAYSLSLSYAGPDESLATAPPASHVDTGRGAFVTMLYAKDLGRTPELKGFKFWTELLAGGVKSKTVAVAIWDSSEHRALVNQDLIPSITFQRSYADALSAGHRAAQRPLSRRSHLGAKKARAESSP